jgi:hypothetical protein
MTGQSRARRALRTLAVCALLPACAALAVTGTAAAAARARYCGKNEVTVIVDLTHFRGGKIKDSCARNPRTGLAALRKAGDTYTFVPRQPGFICTINHRPERCNGAPASAYWSYWHAKRGGKWTYSKLGAGSYHPKAGQIEGWSFGRGRAPHISPP